MAVTFTQHYLAMKIKNRNLEVDKAKILSTEDVEQLF